jgi:hypothetical protein
MSQRGRPLLSNVYNQNAYFSGNGVRTSLVAGALKALPLLGNVLVNKFPRRQILGKQSVAGLRNNRRGCVFYVVRAEQLWNNGVMQPVSKQRLAKHTSA